MILLHNHQSTIIIITHSKKKSNGKKQCWLDLESCIRLGFHQNRNICCCFFAFCFSLFALFRFQFQMQRLTVYWILKSCWPHGVTCWSFYYYDYYYTINWTNHSQSCFSAIDHTVDGIEYIKRKKVVRLQFNFSMEKFDRRLAIRKSNIFSKHQTSMLGSFHILSSRLILIEILDIGLCSNVLHGFIAYVCLYLCLELIACLLNS